MDDGELAWACVTMCLRISLILPSVVTRIGGHPVNASLLPRTEEVLQYAGLTGEASVQEQVLYGIMGKLFTARMPDGSERFVAGMSMGRSRLFVSMTRLIETEFLKMFSGIEDDHGQDEHSINPGQFCRFFEAFWGEGWVGEKRSGLFHNWARHAAGMVENMTLESREWVDRNGERLDVIRYLRPDEGSAQELRSQ